MIAIIIYACKYVARVKAIICLMWLKDQHDNAPTVMHNFITHYARVYGLHVHKHWTGYGKNGVVFHNCLVSGWKWHYLKGLLGCVKKRFKGKVKVHVKPLA